MAGPTPHLVLNLVQLLPERSGGIETYARELIPRIVDRLPGWRVTALVNEEGAAAYPSWDDRVDWQAMSLSWYDRVKRLVWESTAVPRRIRSIDGDLVHNMVNTACLKPGCPQLTTVFDATPQLYRESGESIGSRAFRMLLAVSIGRSDEIVTISRSAAADIGRAYGFDATGIRVVLLAARSPQPPVDLPAVRERFDIPAGRNYFLTPAARRPNKNIPALVRAFASIDDPASPLLLLPGADAGDDVELWELIAERGVEDRVRMIGWVTDQELDSLYTHAIALVFPSLAEGFGLPILEAMQCGCAVATSDVSSMPEIGGEDVLYFDPTDETTITSAMKQLLTDEQLRLRLGTAGPPRAAMFSWDRAADETVAIYHEMIG